ncbi:MAG: DUF2220 family protein [Alkalimonas sp.]|nr:DUF2220 family protein [Alkalimonas sp.]
MHSALSLQALNWLQQLEQRLKRDGSASIKTSGKSATQVIYWCIEQQLLPDHSANLPKVQFTQALLEQIAVTQRQLKQACYRDNVSQHDRLQQAQHAEQELKTAGASPRQSRVLIRLNHAAHIASVPVQTVDIDWQQLPLSDYDVLLVVENLDCLYQLECFTLDLPQQHPLIVYRGDSQYSSGCKALKTEWLQQQKTAIYFGDFDGKGVSIALHEGYDAMLLPEFATLQQQASSSMLPDTQLKYLPAIKSTACSLAFQPYQQLLCQKLKGLRQQQMQDMTLQPVLLT